MFSLLLPFLVVDFAAAAAAGRAPAADTAMRAAFYALSEELKMLQASNSSGAFLTATGRRVKTSLHDCVELLSDASGLVESSLNMTKHSPSSVPADVHVFLSAALTYHSTCVDGLGFVRGREHAMRTRRLLSSALAELASTYPSPGLAEDEVEEGGEQLFSAMVFTPNVVVARDGSGDFTSIWQAVKAAPRRSQSVHVIHIKQGTYREKVSIPKSKTNLMFVGDGMGKTIITGSRSVHDGWTTFRTATVEVSGHGFLARDLTIRNTAGPGKQQAVALRVSSDKAAFYKCSFEGYQDTLYAHAFRQFYRECSVYGTVDFVFGNAAAVFQRCNLVARQPLDKQKNTYTAQGRTDPNQNTGFAFQDCTLDGSVELRQRQRGGVQTFLGRPWKLFSRTVLMGCYEGDTVEPAGWLEWDADFALRTLFYAEYSCRGPGARSGERVYWSRQLRSPAEASRFTAGRFISGREWLGGTRFPFKLGL